MYKFADKGWIAMKGSKHVIYLSLALGMLIYAVPQLHFGGGLTLPFVFAAVWICFAVLVIAANLRLIMGVDEETQAELAKIKKMKGWQLQQKLLGRSRLH